MFFFRPILPSCCCRLQQNAHYNQCNQCSPKLIEHRNRIWKKKIACLVIACAHASFLNLTWEFKIFLKMFSLWISLFKIMLCEIFSWLCIFYIKVNKKLVNNVCSKCLIWCFVLAGGICNFPVRTIFLLTAHGGVGGVLNYWFRDSHIRIWFFQLCIGLNSVP